MICTSHTTTNLNMTISPFFLYDEMMIKKKRMDRKVTQHKCKGREKEKTFLFSVVHHVFWCC